MKKPREKYGKIEKTFKHIFENCSQNLFFFRTFEPVRLGWRGAIGTPWSAVRNKFIYNFFSGVETANQALDETNGTILHGKPVVMQFSTRNT